MPKTKPNVFDGQNISANEFLKTHWQRAPYLFTNTSIDLTCLPNVAQLFELATQDGVQSRIVFSDDDIHYQAVYDEPDAWESLTQHKPTLLVSDIEKWYPAAMRLMDGFPFIKSWRFDDLMMSYAPKGASVGAHTDHYDVFLVQVKGTRIWSYDEQPLAQCSMVEDSELAVIRDYKPQKSFELKPGDILYIPPEIPHHGISSSDDCVTCSIGLRAPSKAELMMAVTEFASSQMSADDRFKDQVTENIKQASIGQHEIEYIRQQLKTMSQADDQQLASYFGQFVTGYRLWEAFDDFEVNTPTVSDQTEWQKNPFAVFAYYLKSADEATLFVNGEVFNTSVEMAKNICDHTHIVYSADDLFQQLVAMHALIPLNQ
ncbi:cupin domain-containing protein [Marinicella litoralis]|uniref:50S ribosomal protein L16 3-hydroxylase n=1 Tax=Marinicella litoralis TaxID=644220 RepID=A0A4R6XVF9_9GAMM|nr:cupin domain-containing protein [Marinicella litoralis]TDR22539.1 50S ribosomal protein L16 3-hydroxylase [Marinicella litoralis]